MSRARVPALATDEHRARLPHRPGLVELAAALLIVGGVIGLVTTLAAMVGGTSDAFTWIGIALNGASVALGLATRGGRLWIVTLNYAAVLGFLDILGSAASPQALVIGLSEVAVVVILLLRKPWFDAVGEVRAARSQPLTPPTARPPIR